METGKLNQDVLEEQAIVQRDRDSYAVVPHFPGGLIDSASLRKLADIADKYHCKVLKMTSAQRIALVGIKKDDIQQVWSDLNMNKGSAIGFCVRSVKICPGMDFCKRAKQDSVQLGLVIDNKHHGRPLPNKFKIGVSGCPNCCAESAVKDIGIIGASDGYRILVGGNAGGQPRIAEMIYEGKSSEETLKIVDDIIYLFEHAARKGQRLSKFIDKIGPEQFKAYLEAPEQDKYELLNKLRELGSK